ncbi:response regulator transcription factor [Sulfurimonas sp. SAG-AH-194-I05]|nr:response regulator transcription factor [Sulfurimonas sp. SAG-AH-194-I05]MDF1876139.1 response regulator transcription factor [Sulfurimonas sp. SAG-AH-194-I05]
MNILVVEDDRLSAQHLIKVLKHEKYICDLALGYEEARTLLDLNTYSIVLLDWNLGDGDGLELLKEMRELGITIPVLMLSANSEIDDRVKVLDNGGDDYLCKPYSHVELLARMRVLLRRETTQVTTLISIDGITLESSKHQVIVNDKEVLLTTSEYDLLELFMQNPNIVLTRYQLSEHLNKSNYSIKHSNIVDVHVKNLRKKLNAPKFIKTVRSVGYTIKK